MKTFKEWYAENKEDLLRKRRERYRKDKAYKAKQRAHARAYYDRVERVTEPKDRRIIKSGRTMFLTIGQLSESMNRDIQTIRAYHRNRVLPEPTAFDGRGWRLYTKRQVALITKVFKRFDEGKLKSLAEVAEIIFDKWERG